MIHAPSLEPDSPDTTQQTKDSLNIAQQATDSTNESMLERGLIQPEDL